MASARRMAVSAIGIGMKRGILFREIQTYTLPELPYEYTTQQVISGDIVTLHHEKNHQAYVINYNKALEQLEEASVKKNTEAIVSLQSAIKFNGGGKKFHNRHGHTQRSNSLQTVRGFSAIRRPGNKAGSADTPVQPQVDWKEWVASKLPGNVSRPVPGSYGFGPRSSPGESRSSFESADDFERRMFGGFNDNDSNPDSFYQKLDRIEKSHRRASTGVGKVDWNGDLGWEDEQIGFERDTLNDGMDDKLKKAALEHDYGEVRSNEDYSFRPDTTFSPGTEYKIQDLDLTKPAVRRNYRRLGFQSTTKEVLSKADFRNARFLQNFITEAGLLWPRKKFGISAKAQRKLVREIKTARAFGLLPFTMMGKKPFAFGKTMEDLDEDYKLDDYVENADYLEDNAEVVAPEDLDIP